MSSSAAPTSSRRRPTPSSIQKRLADRLARSQERNRRRLSMELPERFRGASDDEQEVDVVTGTVQLAGPALQQSLYGLVGAAAKKDKDMLMRELPDFPLEGESESEEEAEASRPASTHVGRGRASPAKAEAAFAKHKSKSSLRNGVKSDVEAEDIMSQSQFLPPKESLRDEEELERPASATAICRDAPLLDRKLKAKAKADVESSGASFVARRSLETTRNDGPSNKKAAVELPVALAEIFKFDEPEEVIGEFPCWYLQSVLLQGYMYITAKHICFYAYIQKKTNTTTKSGHLGKRGKHDRRFKRLWFTLKGDVLSYYTSAADPYFPSGNVDLRYGISAELAPEKGQTTKDTTHFTVTTEKRSYELKADSATSAKEWVKQLQKVIFRSHNDGDSVKISLPIANVVDVESNQIIEFADTIKLRVIDNDDTYAVDDYFFTFFSFGDKALNLLSIMTQESEARKAAIPREGNEMDSTTRDSSPRMSMDAAPTGPKGVRTTLVPLSKDRSSSREPKRVGRTCNRGRASHDDDSRSSSSHLSTEQDRRTWRSPRSASLHGSTESLSNASNSDDAPEVDMSASTILAGDRAFREPTLQTSQPRREVPSSAVPRLRQESQQLSTYQEVERTSQPKRTQTEQDLYPASRKSTDPADSLKLRPSSTAGSMPMRIMAAPIQQAFSVYDYARNQSKRGLSYLGSSPKDYYNKISTAVAGGKRHYSEPGGLAPNDQVHDPEDDLDAAEHERRFQEHFALPESEKLVAVFYCWLHRVLPLYGKIYVGRHYLCFRSLLYGVRTKLRLSFKNIVNVEKEKGFRLKFPGMVVVISGTEEIFFDFSSSGLRDDCVVTVLRGLDSVNMIDESQLLTDDERLGAETAAAEHKLLQEARKDGHAEHDVQLPKQVDDPDADATTFFDDGEASILEIKPKKPLKITCLTIGSRGDVQPYIALCKGLLADGHMPRIATHHEFGPWVEKHGIEFMPVEGDPAELMKICVDNGMFSPSFIYETSTKFRGWLDQLLSSSYEACKGSDLLIESPSAMAGIHVAEALGIPYFRAFTMPWTRTRAYPHAFAVPNSKMGGQYNVMSYILFDTVFWRMTAGQINRWRGKMLGLKPTSLEKLQPNKVPFLYNFSPNVVVPPLDFSAWIRVTGYWFLDEGSDYTPPSDLMAFITKARADGMKLVYIGFGSVTVSDSRALTQQIVSAVAKADVRCILSKGWSDRLDPATKDPAAPPEPALPDAVFQIKSAPHDWLFRQIDAAVHHGGAGTTGASLRAGVPTLIKPFFGDQFFFATRVEDLGVGMHLRKITVKSLGRALWIATRDERLRQKARVLGERIRGEDGVGTAIRQLYRDMEYAKTLIKKKDRASRKVALVDGEDEADEETWTFVEGAGAGDVAAEAQVEQAVVTAR